MKTHTQTTGTGSKSAVRETIKRGMWAGSPRYNGKENSAVQIEKVAHMMASFLGQLVDEGILDSIDEQITMGGMTPKLVASRLLDRFESVAY